MGEPKIDSGKLKLQIEQAVIKYLEAGGNPEFYIISKSDHDRNWEQALTEARREFAQEIADLVRIEYEAGGRHSGHIIDPWTEIARPVIYEALNKKEQ